MRRRKRGPDIPGFTFVPKKRLGQNFLVDRRILSRIADSCELDPEETVLEIGPGQGALTRVILPHVQRIIAVEADRQLAEQLPIEFAEANITAYHEDFLKFDLSRLPHPLKIVGNLPYYISTPIITRVLENRRYFSSLFMTVQKEFGERLVASAGTKDYSSFTCFVQYFARPKILFRIPPKAFRPAPKVESCFMRLDMREEPAVPVRNEAVFFQLIRTAFLQRRKTILNSMSPLYPKDKLAAACAATGVQERSRAENLTLEDYVKMSDELAR